MESGYAYFVRRPRTVRELYRPHDVCAERRFLTVGTVTLDSVEYENFTADMLADRAFLEDRDSLCAVGESLRVLLIRRADSGEGVLVVPDGTGHVRCAAVYRHEP